MPAAGSARALPRPLQRGGRAHVDMPGRRPTTFRNQPVEMVDAAARLAVRTGALVVPTTLLPLGRRWRIEIGPALDPRDVASVDALHERLAAIHGEWTLGAPESPRRLDGWGRATRAGWYRSRRSGAEGGPGA